MKVTDFKLKKQKGEKIAILTCYDYPSARIVAKTNLDAVLVGDTLAMAVHGHKDTTTATMDMMALHTHAVARGLTHQLLISDLPFLSYRQSIPQTVVEVQRLIQAGAHAVKLEGGDDHCCETIHHLVTSGVPVVGHIGLTPQSVHQLGGYKVQGKEKDKAELLIHQGKALEKAGCCALVIECIPQALAQVITRHLTIPTIGIGAGQYTDGQVLVWHDMLGFEQELQPRFVKRFAEAEQFLFEAIERYVDEVQTQRFPTEAQAYCV